MISDIPEFDVTLAEDGRVAFVHQAQAHAYLRRLRASTADTVFSLQIYPVRAKRSDRQNRGFHAMVKPWLLSESKTGWTIDALKYWLLCEVFGRLEVIHPHTGEVIAIPAEPHTSKLTVGQFCELIDRTLELAAEDGTILQAPDEYLKAKAKLARRAA